MTSAVAPMLELLTPIGYSVAAVLPLLIIVQLIDYFLSIEENTRAMVER